MNTPELYLVEPYNAYTPKKQKHWMEIVEEQNMLARIIAEQQASVEQNAVGHGQAHGNGCAGAPKLRRHYMEPAPIQNHAPAVPQAPAPKATPVVQQPSPAPVKPVTVPEVKPAPIVEAVKTEAVKAEAPVTTPVTPTPVAPKAPKA